MLLSQKHSIKDSDRKQNNSSSDLLRVSQRYRDAVSQNIRGMLRVRKTLTTHSICDPFLGVIGIPHTYTQGLPHIYMIAQKNSPIVVLSCEKKRATPNVAMHK